MDSYIFKLFGQRHLVRGNFPLAAGMAAYVDAAASPEEVQAALQETEPIFRIRTTISHFQESFALAHELIHTLLQDGEGQELRASFSTITALHRERIGRSLESLDGGDLQEHLTASLTADEEALAQRRGRSPSANLAEEDVAEFIAQYSLLLDQLDSPEVEEEAMCDYFGAVLTADVMGDDGVRALVYASSVLGLLHLRLLQYLDDVADPILKSKASFHEAILRASILRTALSADLKARADGEALAFEFDQIATGFNRMHSTFILDQVVALDLARFAEDASQSVTHHDTTHARARLGFGEAIPHFTTEQARALARHRSNLTKPTIDRIVADGGTAEV